MAVVRKNFDVHLAGPTGVVQLAVEATRIESDKDCKLVRLIRDHEDYPEEVGVFPAERLIALIVTDARVKVSRPV